MKAYAVVKPTAAKRLIAKGVAAHPIVERALREGTIVITLGTTNAFVGASASGGIRSNVVFRSMARNTRWRPMSSGFSK